MQDDRIRELAKPFECYADSQQQTIRGDDIVAFARAVLDEERSKRWACFTTGEIRVLDYPAYGGLDWT